VREQDVFARAIAAFLVLPGVVAFAVPLSVLLSQGAWPVHPAGSLLLVIGIGGLAWCVRDFYVLGKGTLAPWAPPRHLVVVGLYRWSRNPMYLSVTLILLGWAVTFGSWSLLLYAAAVLVAFHLRVVLGEEPWLARTHGAQWDAYVRDVPRWIA
jgi:protein-S-isoprenylcysteine O-methyltransferase Ste14